MSLAWPAAGPPNRAEVVRRSIDSAETLSSNCEAAASAAPRILPGTKARGSTGDDGDPNADRPIIARGFSPGELPEARALEGGETTLRPPVSTGDAGMGCIAMDPYMPIRSPDDAASRAPLRAPSGERWERRRRRGVDIPRRQPACWRLRRLHRRHNALSKTRLAATCGGSSLAAARLARLRLSAPSRAGRLVSRTRSSRDCERNCRRRAGRAAQDAPLLGQRRGTDPCARVPSRGSRNNVVRVMAAADETLALVGLVGKKKDADTVSAGRAFAPASRSRNHPESLRRAHQVGGGADSHRIRAWLSPPSRSCALAGARRSGRARPGSSTAVAARWRSAVGRAARAQGGACCDRCRAASSPVLGRPPGLVARRVLS